MTQQTLPIHEIQIIDRQRIDLGNIDDLAASLRLYGLIQPIVLSKERRLIAGGRRLAAAKQLGWTEIPVVYSESLSKEELYILELEENIRRKEETWQEKCLHIALIHQLKCESKAKDSILWTQSATGELLGIPGTRQISESLKLASYLKAELNEDKSIKESARFWKCESISEAIGLIFRDQEEAARAYLAELQRKNSIPIEVYEEEQVALSEFETTNSNPDALQEERDRYYSNSCNPPDSFEAYWEEKQKWATQTKQTIYLSNKLINSDSIKFMLDNPSRFDHIITDIPYGIDMTMLNQQNVHGDMKDIDLVEELHDVKYNLKLIADFFPAAFFTLKEKGFCITWCDIMNWQFMYDCAIKAGFAVQKWPIVWTKNNAMNQCVSYNTTKDFEIAIVCRKKGTALMNQPGTSIVHSGKDELCSSLGHPFSKPFEIWRFLVESFTLEGSSILEPFAGRGSGVISMLKLNRNVIGVELDTAHYNALLENVKQLHYLPLNPNYIFK